MKADIEKVSECFIIQPQGFKVFLWVYSTNEFHDAAGPLFSSRSQMASKCGENEKKKEKLAHETIAECVTDVPTTF